MKYSLRDITDGVCTRFGLTRDDIRGPARQRSVARPRQILMYLGHEMAHYRQWALGKKISHGRDFKAMQKAICAAHGFDPKVF